MKTASYSVLAKVRVRYGRRLTESDYNALTVCRSLSEFVSYLRARGEYGQVMAEAAGLEISRGRLEMLLREREFRENIALCSAKQNFGDSLFHFFIGRAEADFLLNVLRVISSPGELPYINSLPRMFFRYTGISPDQLKSARDYPSFLEAIRGSRYYQALLHLGLLPGIL